MAFGITGGTEKVDIAAQALTPIVVSTGTNPTYDFHTEMARGNVSGASPVHKFGLRVGITTSYSVISSNGIWLTPQVAGAVALRVKAGNAADDASGVGAREVSIQGLDETGALVTEAVATAGTSASSTTSATFMRVFRAWVSSSGTYTVMGSAPTSHTARIAIESAAGAEWAEINIIGASKGQSRIGAYSVPLGSEAYITGITVTSDGAKVVDYLFMQRQGILATAAPYQAARTVLELFGIEGAFSFNFIAPLGPFPALTDLVWLAKGAATPDVSVDFEMQLFTT